MKGTIPRNREKLLYLHPKLSITRFSSLCVGHYSKVDLACCISLFNSLESSEYSRYSYILIMTGYHSDM